MAQSIKCGKDPTVHSKFCLDCALKEPTAESRVTALKKLFADIITHGRDEKGKMNDIAINSNNEIFPFIY